MRLASQTFFFIISWLALLGVPMTGLMYPYFFCVASPGAWAACPIGLLEYSFTIFPLGVVVLLYIISFLGIMTMLFGRGFCGWACPIGFLNEIIFHIRRYFRPVIEPIGRAVEKTPIPSFFKRYSINPRLYKYIILVLIPVTSYASGKMIFTDIDPIGGITATIPTLLQGGYRPDRLFAVKMFLVFVWFVMGLLVVRSWCKYLCPLGAAFAPMNKVSLLSLSYDENKCINCNLCIKACPMDVNIFDDSRSTECILCGRCVAVCPTAALKMKFAGKTIFVPDRSSRKAE